MLLKQRQKTFLAFCAILFLASACAPLYYLDFEASSENEVQIDALQKAIIASGWLVTKNENGIVETNERTFKAALGVPLQLKLVMNVSGKKVLIQPELYGNTSSGKTLIGDVKMAKSYYDSFLGNIRSNLQKEGFIVSEAKLAQ